MHNLFSRINNVSSFWSSCMMCLLGAIALSSLFFNADPKGSLEVATVKVAAVNSRRHKNRNQEFAFVNFNITADLTPLFNWNTKQVFVYLGAEYTNGEWEKNDVVIWDRIIRRKEDAVVDVSGKNKYVFKELSASFKNIPSAHYALKYNVMPHVGMLTYGEAGRTVEPVAFPALSKK